MDVVSAKAGRADEVARLRQEIRDTQAEALRIAVLYSDAVGIAADYYDQNNKLRAALRAIRQSHHIVDADRIARDALGPEDR